MREDLIIQRVREGIQKRGEKPVAERIQDMVDRGVVDKDGNVLLRMPSGPKKDLGSTSVRSLGEPVMAVPLAHVPSSMGWRGRRESGTDH